MRCYEISNRSSYVIDRIDVYPSTSALAPDPYLFQIEVFRQCCKICVASKLFAEAKALMMFSLKLSEETHGATHPCHAQTLLIYGFYLLNMSKCRANREGI